MVTRFDLWKEYEAVAMHFNDLLIKLRTQSLAGVGTLATVLGFVAKGEVSDDLRWEVLTAGFLILTLFWIAISCLDYLYYNRLLLGAVSAIRQLESEGRPDDVPHRINLSVRVDGVARGRYAEKGAPLFSGHRIFYAIVFLVLSGGSAGSAMMIVCQ